ncbi:ATP-binding cassette domain-containing protein [Diplocloster agilis]|uniref:ABC transporter ATP-binding protein n=1 Tax=Diplocloster agilis TaxID=2850323 RepID=A0A949NDI0_9FIRM|nr:ABC transporter ATP-binding protein [Diplocloster agilis]MBU9735991.1 ABC transporter ATP-binding protein [Diplocloster agilis]
MSGIEIKQVSKRFGDVTALDHVNICFQKNKIYGLLGRNGAGKSTLLNVITNRIFADEGEVLVDGEPSVENDRVLRKIYLMSEQSYYPPGMKVKEAFQWSAEFYPDFDKGYAEKTASLFQLPTKKKIHDLSTGYQSIFKICIAMAVNTPYVLFDEPVLGLDANHRQLFYKLLIEKYSDSPSTIVISTHLIEEVANVIEQIIIIKNGRIIRDETTEELLSKGYTVSGNAALVDRYTAGRKLLGEDTLGGLKSAYLLGSVKKEEVPAGLEVSKLDLQKLFIQMTND